MPNEASSTPAAPAVTPSSPPAAPPAATPAPPSVPGAPPPVAEAKPPAPPPEADVGRARQLAALAKRERDIREADAKLKEREAKVAGVEKAREQARENPLAFMEANGLTFEAVQDFVLNGKQPTQEQKRDAELHGIKAEVDRLRKLRESEDQRAEASKLEQARRDWQSQAAEAAKAAGETYELTLAFGQQAMLLANQAAEAHYRETGTWAPLPDILAQVEKYYETQLLAEPVLTSKKLRAKIQPEVPKPAVQAASKPGPNREVPRTLTNSAAAAAPPTDPNRPLTPEERRQATIEGLRRLKRGA